MSDKNRVLLFDTTMRDGEQSPGASMSLEEKIQISRVFDEMGIDIIEAGFPIASPGDFEAVSIAPLDAGVVCPAVDSGRIGKPRARRGLG